MAIEHMMYFGLGFLIASIMALIVLPSVWKRAVRLTRKRIEAATPMTMAEFRADKDQLRAQFALTQRRLERNIENLRDRLTEQLADLTVAQSELAVARNARDRAVAVQGELEERSNQANERIHELERELADVAQQLRNRERDYVELVKARNADIEAEAADPENPLAPRKSRLGSIKDALTASDRETFDVLDGINEAYSRISRAGSSLDALIEHTSKASGEPEPQKPRPATLLAEELSQEEELEDLHGKISNVETIIRKEWGKNDLDKENLRDQLGDIASTVSHLLYSNDGTKSDDEESLFDRIAKYAGDDLNDPPSPQASKQRAERRRQTLSGPTLSDRMSAFRDIHANN